MSLAKARSILVYSLLTIVLLVTMALTWLRWESAQPRNLWFDARQGQIESVESESAFTEYGDLSESVRLNSTSGLQVSFRVIRETTTANSFPVLLVLGGHRTGKDAVALFGDVGARAVIGIDYPYDGPDKVRGALNIARTIPLARRAFLDTTPAVSLVIDWLAQQTWADTSRIVVVGASLGVPFAASATARDSRIAGMMLVHGAADNRLWLEAQVARRIDTKALHYPLSTVLHWLAYGPILDTSKHVANVTPRPVLIVGARDDERTPAGQTELLFAAAFEPKRMRFTDGQHIEPERKDIIAELLRIADEEMTFLAP
ncbi:MAG: alpha/beta hydrolase family protein [Woeseiaceae bacterium]